MNHDTSSRSEYTPSLPPPQRNGRILVVDDDELVSSTLELMLSTAGYDVTAVLSGREASDLLQTSHFDLLITDFRMPVMTGLDLIQEIRYRGNTIPVVILTGFFEQLEKERVELGSLAVQEVLMKPISMKDFLARVAAHLPKTQLLTPN